MGFFNSFALKRMAKENFIEAYRRCGYGRPGSAAITAIEGVASAADTGSAATLEGALQRFADSLGNDSLRIAVGSGVLFGLFSQFPDYYWAANYVSEWSLRH